MTGHNFIGVILSLHTTYFLIPYCPMFAYSIVKIQGLGHYLLLTVVNMEQKLRWWAIIFGFWRHNLWNRTQLGLKWDM